MIELQSGPAVVTIDPDSGGRISSVSVAGLELLVARPTGKPDPLAWGMYPMAPWAGRVRKGRFSFGGKEWRLPINLAPHAIHGTAFQSVWTVIKESADRTDLAVAVGEDGVWPFSGILGQTFALDPGGLTMELRLDARESMPASLGWHPWFVRDLARGGALEVELEATERWERGEDGLPTGELIPPGSRPAYGWDDCFTKLRSPPVLTWPGAIELTLTSNCDHWVVFDSASHAVCVEPQTGPPDALNLGPTVVEPGSPLVATFRWSWRLG